MKTSHVCICQYFEKYHFEIFKLTKLASLWYWPHLFNQMILANNLIVFAQFTWQMYNTCSWWLIDVVSRNESILDKHKYGGWWKGQKMGIVMVAAKQKNQNDV